MFCCRAGPALRRSFLLASILIAPRVSRAPALYIMWYVVTVVTVWWAQCTGTASELRNRIFMCWIFGLAARGSGETVQAGTWLMVELGHCTPQTRACMSLPGLARVHHNTFYFSLNWLVLWHWGGKHVNYAKRQQEPRKKIWNDETKSRTKQRTHKFYESLTYLTAIMSCFSSPRGSGYTSAPAPPPTGLFWAEFLILRCMKIWNGDLHEKKRSTALTVVGADGALDWGRARASFSHNCDFHIEWCIDWRSF